MKVGILTVHRAINIGAVLQCYALQELIRSLGHEAWVIDYEQEKVERTDRIEVTWSYRLNLLKHGHLRGFLFPGIIKKNIHKKKDMYDCFLKEKLHLTKSCDKNHLPQDFEAYVIGSDQLWNSNIFGYQEPVFWGYFQRIKESRVVAFAPSSSKMNISLSDASFIQNGLNNFHAISCREEEVTDYLNAHFHLPSPAVTVLDPTLTVQPSVWRSLCKGKYRGERYVLVYGARPYKGNYEALRLKAEELAKNTNCGVRTIQMNELTDYLDIINNATYVVTSSFHGVAFSLIFNKPLFAVMYGDEQDARYVNLLKSIGAENMLIPIEKELRPQNVNYIKINECLEEKRIFSADYLKKALS